MSSHTIPPDDDGADRTPRPRFEIVGADEPRATENDLRDGSALRVSFTPLADLETGGTLGFEVRLGAGGDLPVAPRDWARGVALGQAGEVEALALQRVLGHRRAIPGGAALVVSLSAPGFVSPLVHRELDAANSLAGVWLAVRCAPGTDPRAMRSAISAARALGASVVLDEAEVGFSALQRLVRLRPDAIRIAPDFVEELDRDAARSAVVEALVALTRRTGSRVLADGVSSAAELSALVALGVVAGSGPLFGEDLPAAGPLPAGALALIESSARAAQSGAETVSSLVEFLPTLPVDASLAELADAFLDDARSDFVVLVDRDARPAALAERAALLRAEPYEHPALAVTGQTEVRTAARRAAARSSYERFDPVVCTDARGRVIGVVRVDRLLDALAGPELPVSG